MTNLVEVLHAPCGGSGSTSQTNFSFFSFKTVVFGPVQVEFGYIVLKIDLSGDSAQN